MQIESIIRRKAGTTVTLGGQEYRFLPNDLGAHVAEVEEPAHIQRFLSIAEGFRIYVEGQAPAAPAPVPPPADQPPGGDAGADAPTFGDGEVTPPAPEPEGEDDDEGDAPDDGEDYAARLAAMTREEMEAEFERLEGRKPNARIKDETLREKLAEIAG